MSKATALNRQPGDIDWQHLWQQSCLRRKSDRNDKEFWNRRSPSFASKVNESPYAGDFLKLIAPEPHWSVLDVGCGPGTLALPLARLVRQVTAIDFSQGMIDILTERCRAESLTNVVPRVLDLRDDWDAAGIAQHDVVIASRSLVVEDLRGALLKIADKARHRVIISSLVGDGPFDRKIFTAIGRDFDRGPDYIYVYNLLHQMNIFADIGFITNLQENRMNAGACPDKQRVYNDIEDAVQSFHWMVRDMTSQEEERLRNYLKKNLVRRENGYALAYAHPVRWAIISWRT